MIIKILDTEIEADLLNPDIIERYETEKDKAAEIAKLSVDKYSRMSECIRAQCEAVINCLDNVLGKGTADMVMGGSTDLIKCLDAFSDLCQAYDRYAVPIVKQKIKELESLFSSDAKNED